MENSLARSISDDDEYMLYNVRSFDDKNDFNISTSFDDCFEDIKDISDEFENILLISVEMIAFDVANNVEISIFEDTENKLNKSMSELLETVLNNDILFDAENVFFNNPDPKFKYPLDCRNPLETYVKVGSIVAYFLTSTQLISNIDPVTFDIFE